MVQRGQQLGFAFKPCQPFFVLGELFGQGFDSDFSTEFGLTRTPYLTHPALTECGNDFVVREDLAGLDHP